MKFRLELTRDDLKEMVTERFADLVHGGDFDPSRVVIETKSKQNYRAEWEEADFRATYEH